jgi:anthranilate synthase component I
MRILRRSADERIRDDVAIDRSRKTLRFEGSIAVRVGHRCLSITMTFPSFAQFQTLATQGNFIPVYQELVADLDTPVSAWYRVCAGQPYSFLLESVEGGESIGRYSLLGCNPLWTLEARGDQTTQTYRDGQQQTFDGDPFVALSDCLAPFRPVKLPELPPGIGGLFGYWGYELIQWIEPKVTVHPMQAGDLPDGLWMQVDHLLVFDQVKRKIWAIAYADLRDPATDRQVAYDTACTQVQALVDQLRSPLDHKTFLNWTPPQAGAKDASETLDITSNFTRDRYCTAVETAKAHIKAGDIFQVVIAQQLSTPFVGEPFDLYRSLRLVNPSPYMAFFNFQEGGECPRWDTAGDRPTDRGHPKTRPNPSGRSRPRTGFAGRSEGSGGTRHARGLGPE